MRRVVGLLAWFGLAQALWANAVAPCPMAAHHAPPAAVAHAGHHMPSHDLSAHDLSANDLAANDLAAHDRSAHDAPATDPSSPPAAGCPMTMACAPMLLALAPSLPTAPVTPVSTQPSASPEWQEGIVRALEPPPPRLG